MKLSSTHKTYLGLALMVVCLRLCVWAVCGLAFDFGKHPNEDWFSIWDRWDSKHYEYIAENLYQIGDGSAEDHHFVSRFPPLYPLLVRVTSNLTSLPLFSAGVVVALTCLILATCLLYQLVKNESGSAAAGWRAALLLNLFPAAYFSQSAYSDALFVLLVVALLAALREGQTLVRAWVIVGLALLTRVAGVIFVFPVAWELARKIYRKKAELADYLGSLVPIASLAIYLQINKSFFGDYWAFLKDYASSNHSVQATATPFAETISSLWLILHEFPQRFSDRFFMLTQGWGAILMLLVALSLMLSAKRLAAATQIFGWCYLVFIGSLRWAVSTPRYLWAQVPAFIALARLNNRFLFCALAALMFALQVYLAIEFTTGEFAY